MFIKLLSVSAKNFMSIGNTPIELDLTKHTKSLIIGKNGNGKSVLIEAIIFALYGKPYRKINKGALVNSINGKGCEVIVKFQVNDKQYKIVRTIKPDSLKIYANDVLIEQLASVGDYQEMLETTILKMDYSTCCQMVIIGSMGYIPFLQLKSADRRLFVESVLDLQLFSDMNKKLKTIHAEEKTKYTTSQNAINVYKSKIDSYEGVIRTLEADKGVKILAIDESIREKMEEYKKYIGLAEQAQKDIDGVTGLTVTTDIQRDINTASSEISTAQTENTKLNNKIKFFDVTAECASCGQIIDANHKEKHITMWNETISYNNNIIKEKTEQNIARSLIVKQAQEKDRELATKRQNLKTNQDSAEWIKKDIVRLGKEKQTLGTTDDGALSDAKKKLEDNINLHADEVITSKEFFTNIQVYDTMLTALKDSEAKAEIVKQYIPLINLTVNQYMDKLGLYIKFELDENFNETLKSRHRDDFTYESFSMGERMRIDSSLLFAWREITKKRTGIETNLLFFDEVLEILDDEGFDVILGVVDSIPNMNCFIISHKQNLDVKFDNIIEMIKVQDFTQIK
jgi:DNA repair exonuclease SbcCD ATPase subunit